MYYYRRVINRKIDYIKR